MTDRRRSRSSTRCCSASTASRPACGTPGRAAGRAPGVSVLPPPAVGHRSPRGTLIIVIIVIIVIVVIVVIVVFDLLGQDLSAAGVDEDFPLPFLTVHADLDRIHQEAA